MKNSYLALLACVLLACLPLFAQERVVERTYISTDKDVYVAGDAVWYSAFCVDAARGTLSPVSATVSRKLSPSTTVPSSGIRSPGRTTMISPILTSSGETFTSLPFRTDVAAAA